MVYVNSSTYKNFVNIYKRDWSSIKIIHGPSFREDPADALSSFYFHAKFWYPIVFILRMFLFKDAFSWCL